MRPSVDTMDAFDDSHGVHMEGVWFVGPAYDDTKDIPRWAALLAEAGKLLGYETLVTTPESSGDPLDIHRLVGWKRPVGSGPVA